MTALQRGFFAGKGAGILAKIKEGDRTIRCAFNQLADMIYAEAGEILLGFKEGGSYYRNKTEYIESLAFVSGISEATLWWYLQVLNNKPKIEEQRAKGRILDTKALKQICCMPKKEKPPVEKFPGWEWQGNNSVKGNVEIRPDEGMWHIYEDGKSFSCVDTLDIAKECGEGILNRQASEKASAAEPPEPKMSDIYAKRQQEIDAATKAANKVLNAAKERAAEPQTIKLHQEPPADTHKAKDNGKLVWTKKGDTYTSGIYMIRKLNNYEARKHEPWKLSWLDRMGSSGVQWFGTLAQAQAAAQEHYDEQQPSDTHQAEDDGKLPWTMGADGETYSCGEWTIEKVQDNLSKKTGKPWLVSGPDTFEPNRFETPEQALEMAQRFVDASKEEEEPGNDFGNTPADIAVAVDGLDDGKPKTAATLMDEARNFRKLKKEGKTIPQLADEFGLNQRYIRRRLKLLRLAPAEQEKVHKGKLSLEKANIIVDKRDYGETVNGLDEAAAKAACEQAAKEEPPKQVVLMDVVKLEFAGNVLVFFDRNGDRVAINGSPEMPKLAQDALNEQLAAVSEQVKASTKEAAK